VSKRLLLCEGPEDLAALREILHVHFSATRTEEPNPNSSSKVEQWSVGGKTIRLINALDRQRVLRFAVELITSDSPSDPIEWVGLSFDPNGDDEARWRAWLEKGLQRLNLRRTGSSYEANPPERIPLGIIPLPWLSTGPVHYGLSNSQCLERCAIDALSATYPNHHRRVEKWINELRTEQPAHPPSWKTAARLWNALSLPDVSGQGFYSQVFGNHEPLRLAILEGLTQSNLRASIEMLLF
jgi:hypothetical protein